MKIKKNLVEVVALAVAGACVTVYGYVLGYANKAKENSGIDVGEEALAKHVNDICNEEPEENEDALSADTQ